MPVLTEGEDTCAYCERTIYLYCHSAAGRIRATAWTDVYPDGDDDPRYGTRCDWNPDAPGFGRHAPALQT